MAKLQKNLLKKEVLLKANIFKSMKNFLYSLSVVLKSKFIFKNPNKSEIVIFDDNSIKDLNNLIKKFDNYFILQVRRVNINKFYITFAIIKNTIINYFKTKNLFSAYLVSLITKINPKVVLTNIDNSVKFSELAKFFQNKINFVAIQNATRNPEREKFLYENNITKKKSI